MSASEFSRASTTSCAPSSRANSIPAGARDRHLGRTMDGKVGRKRADQAANAHVLHDRRVGTRGDDPAQIVLGLRQLIGEDQRVEGHVAADAAAVQVGHQGRQVRLGEVPGPHPGVEAFQAEIDRVRPVLHRRARALPVAGRSQQLGPPHGRRRGRGGGGQGVKFGGHARTLPRILGGAQAARAAHSMPAIVGPGAPPLGAGSRSPVRLPRSPRPRVEAAVMTVMVRPSTATSRPPRAGPTK